MALLTMALRLMSLEGLEQFMAVATAKVGIKDIAELIGVARR